MKKINTLTMMILLTYSFSIAQELEVEGDLTVTGTIESVTIDSMQAEIDSLNAKINSLHGGNRLETRVFNITYSIQSGWEGDFIALSDITGYELENGLVSVFAFDIGCCNGSSGFQLWLEIEHIGGANNSRVGSLGDFRYGQLKSEGLSNIIFNNINDGIRFMALNSQVGDPGNANITLAVTAQFPD